MIAFGYGLSLARYCLQGIAQLYTHDGNGDTMHVESNVAKTN